MSLRTIRMKMVASLAAFLLVGLTSSSVFAALAVNPIFRSNMVLQSGMTCPVFGTGDVGSTVTVSFQNQTISTTVGSDGRWQVNLSSMPVNATPNTLTVSATGSATVTFTGVQVGEVWVSAGQSNMEWDLQKADGSAPVIADAANHNIRLFDMGGFGTSPATSSWTIANSTTAAAFSAVCYWHGLELEERYNVPIGLIDASQGGSQINEWYTNHTGDLGGMLYDNRIRPIQPFAVRGAMYYQGETASDPANYGTMLPDMIAQWRNDWGRPDLPFGIVQIPSSGPVALGQFNASQSVANTWLVVTYDVLDKSLHPTNKKPVGIRMALGARGTVYGDNIEYSGPVRALPSASFVTGNKVVLNFTHLGNGLITDGSAPIAFEVAGSDGRWQSATATIVGNTIEVSSSRVSAPTAVRYNLGRTVGNVSNSVNIPVEGGASTVTMLPASLFEMTVGGSSGGTPPNAPSNLAASAVSSSQINLSWTDNASDESGFEIDRATDSVFSANLFSTTVGSNLTSYQATGLAASTTYYFRVRATNSAGDSANSDTASATTQGGTPGTASHVESITVAVIGAGQGSKVGQASVLIRDDQGNPVPNATASGTFSGSLNESASGVTDGSGVATLQTTGTAKGSVSITFCVGNVTHATLSYDSAANVETCDSN